MSNIFIGKSQIFLFMSRIVETALKYLGEPAISYNNGCDEGFYCSSFVQQVLLDLKIPIPKFPNTDRILSYSEEFCDMFGLTVHEELIEPGDLIFFSKNGFRPTHVAFYIGDGKMIHSPGINGKKIEIISIDEYIENNPLNYDPEWGYEQLYVKNPISYRRPAIPTGERYQEVIT
jgi:cell wall-associated NlpC family hydrolase